ncbi:F0F1 ATP synthase subunit alpha [Butyrivibrio sp. AE3004]|uniref:F0F1 ATP synthase subunit alpha n=1 Tax=Butyrivibrio sp. AE3004 TaxID=1506994 RepID=UPI00055E2F09|nr:F0F1 ATP synthase subunit alpha [Butyrivibrio sp. AE3004]
MVNDNKARLRYSSVAPNEGQAEQIKKTLAKKFNNPDLELEIVHDPKVGGGFIVNYGNFEYDWSDDGRTRQLKELIELTKKRQNTSAENLVSIIRDRVNNFDLKAEGKEVGKTIWVGDGIANVVGIDHAFYGEIVRFEDGTKGMVQDIRDDHIGVILFGSDEGIREGSRCVRTYKQAGIPVGEAFVGRVIDALGNPIDGKEEIKTDVYRPVEEPAPGIVERRSVNEPLETGILSIDTMFPIGRGQRELIIGDRQTGKTSIAMDAILNQKGKDVICVYVAIGQKASTIAKLINTLREAGAMEYSIIVASTASDSAPLQYIAPYAGTAMAEYFMLMGKDVLIVYDDLSKHAVAYRALSLLLERSPGREAYPGDVFYLHSRLLERSSKLSSDLGGGSITALPIIETQAGDVSAYIPTNVISITDGQIFLESDLFFEGMRPAVNVGLSVSRVGSAAQTKAMKKAAGSIRIDLAQYREMAVFTQFASDLDETTKNQLRHGSVLMELLKQPLGKPYSMHEQVILLVCANGNKLDFVPVNQVRDYKDRLLKFFEENRQDIVEDLEKSKDLSESTKKDILEAADQFERINNDRLKDEIKKKRKVLTLD